MFDRRMIAEIIFRTELAHHNAPKDIFTWTARASVKVVTALQIVLLPVSLVTTAVGGCLIALTFGLLPLILSVVWWPFLALLIGTSWLWLHAWYLRPLLLVPGILIAALSHLYVILMPEPERDVKYTKLALTDEWPLSWFLLCPPELDHREMA